MTIPQTTDEDSIRALFSASYEEALNNYKGSCYLLGAKKGGSKGIDCSGFVYKGLADAFSDLRDCGIVPKAVGAGTFNTSSEYQFAAIAKGSGAKLEGRGSDFAEGGQFAGQLKAGMILARSSGKDLGWNANRKLGIDHIVCIYKDSQTGELMVAESSGRKSAETGGTGVQRTRLDEWLERNRNKHLFAADPVQMVMNDANGATSNIRTVSADPSGNGTQVARNDGVTAPAAAPAGGNADPQESSRPSFNKSSAGMWGALALLIAAAYVAHDDDAPDPDTPRPRPATMG